jgi:maltodextrin utilization protein YvdJ
MKTKWNSVKTLFLSILMMIPIAGSAQNLKSFTLEDLNFGGNQLS